MNKRLYVGNLSYDTTEDKLREAFGELGNVQDATVITDRYTGRSRGFGFVEMATEEGAEAAVANMNDSVLDGRTIKVAEANPRPTSQSRDNEWRSGSNSY